MQAVLDANPFPDAEPSRVGVLFLDTAPGRTTMEGVKGQADEEIEPGEREIYIHFPSGMGRAKLRLAVMSKGTMRNINTVTKLVKMSSG